MTDTTGNHIQQQSLIGPSRRRLFAVWTVSSALTVWLGLSVAEGIAAERCHSDGLAWNWKSWSCEYRHAPLSLPQGLRRSH